MYPRLLLARDLLTKDGVIFISIDDNEQANLKLLCDDVFGEENFISSICVKMSHLSGMKMSHKEKKIPKIKEFVLLYSKNKDDFSLNTVFIPGKWEKVLDRYDYFVDINENISSRS
jgi:adenine-specific DNA-methyltransferase